MSVVDRYNFLWLIKISNILNECGMTNIWNTQTFLNSTWLINTVKLKLRDQFEQIWHSLIDDSPKAINYKLFETSFQMEEYFELLEHKKPLISADLEPQIISYQLSRVDGVILIEIIEYAFCVMMISEMNSIIFYSVNFLILVENYYYQSIITVM